MANRKPIMSGLSVGTFRFRWRFKMVNYGSLGHF